MRPRRDHPRRRLVAVEHSPSSTARRFRHVAVEFAEPVAASELRRCRAARRRGRRQPRRASASRQARSTASSRPSRAVDRRPRARASEPRGDLPDLLRGGGSRHERHAHNRDARPPPARLNRGPPHGSRAYSARSSCAACATTAARRSPGACGLGVMSAFDRAAVPVDEGFDRPGARTAIPAGVKQAFGITDLGTVEAFLHAEMFSLFLPLALALPRDPLRRDGDRRRRGARLLDSCSPRPSRAARSSRARSLPPRSCSRRCCSSSAR